MLRLILIFRRLKYPLQIQVNNCTFLITQRRRRRLRLRPSIWCQVSPHQSSTISKDIISSSSSRKKNFDIETKLSALHGLRRRRRRRLAVLHLQIASRNLDAASHRFHFLLLLFGSVEKTRRCEHFPELLEAFFFLFEAVDIPPGGLGVTSIELQCLYKQTN